MEHIGLEKGLCTLVLAELKALGVKVPKVKKVKPLTLKQEKGVRESRHKIFGASLSDQEWVTDSDSDCPLPKFIAEATDYLKSYMQAEIGLFRKAGSVVRQRELRAKLEDGGSFMNCEPNDVASLLKQWLRELPEPVIPVYLHDLFIRCQNLDSEDDRIHAVLLSCLFLPSEHLYTLKHLLNFLHNMAVNSDVNKMSVHNLAVIMAPNLLPCGNDNAGKSSNLVQCCTSIVEILIANADLVGTVPQKITEQLSEESSDYQADVLVCSPHKTKRKFKTGGGGGKVVTDFVSGIKKIVGGNLTPMNTFLDVSELHSLRSSTRKKNFKDSCTSETPYFTPTAKISRLRAPLNGLGANTPLSHFRRKSFGLLNKKPRKRAKTVMKCGPYEENSSFVQESITPCSPSVIFHDVTSSTSEEETKAKSVCNVTVSVDIKVIPSIQITENSSIKRANSECPIGDEKVNTRKHSVNSLSTGNLPSKRPQSFDLQDPNVNRQTGKNCRVEVDRKSVKRHSTRNRSDSCLSTDSNKSVKTYSLRDGKSEKYSTCSKRGSRSRSRLSTNSRSSAVTPSSDAVPQKKSRSNSSRHSSNRSGHKTATNSDKYEADSNLESQHRFTEDLSTDDIAESFLNIHLNNQTNVFTCATPNDQVENPLPGLIRRNLNKSSLKRGRPNTVKTGLPSELCPKYSYDSTSFSRSEKSQNTEESEKVPCASENEISMEFLEKDSTYVSCEAISIFSEAKKTASETGAKNLELSMKSEVAESPTKTNENKSQANLAPVPFNLELMQSYETNANSPNIPEKPKCKTKKTRKRTSSTDISILSPTLKLAESETIESSFEENGKNVDLTSIQPNSVSDKENIYPDETWHSASESFINANLIPVETHCKRESIIQIMVKNAGKVRQNVQHYDHIAKDKCHMSFKEPGSGETKKALTEMSSVSPRIYGNSPFVTPRSKCVRSYSQNLPSQEIRVTRSQSKKGVKMTKSPFPLPPKFVCNNDKSLATGSPLREVTNLKSDSKDSSNSGKSFKLSNTSCKRKDSPISENSKTIHNSLTKNDSAVKRFKQKVRHSYEGNAPSKLTKESRSESSPLLANSSDTAKDLAQSPLLRKSFHSSSFVSPSSNILPNRTASKASIRDINDLENIHLFNTWECKM